MNSKLSVPEYTDGCFQLFRVQQKNNTGFPEEELVDQKMTIWYREISVFDHLQYDFHQGGKEVTAKIRIPVYKDLDSHCYCKIGSEFHQVFNSTHVLSKEGFQETEITLVKPENNLEVAA